MLNISPFFFFVNLFEWINDNKFLKKNQSETLVVEYMDERIIKTFTQKQRAKIFVLLLLYSLEHIIVIYFDNNPHSVILKK